jgi:protein-L-isoaspartate(D-aspartate) O-methyltransferase
MNRLSRAFVLLLLVSTCNPGAPTLSGDAAADPPPVDSPRARALRERLVSTLIVEGDLPEGRVAEVLRRVPRHAFVPDVSLDEAYANRPLPIGFEQTISQPAVVAMMTEALELSPHHRVLEIGTGSGYQAAILGVLSREVFTVELVPELAERSRRRLADLGYSNVHVRAGDGYQGWPEHAPFDRIIVTAAPPALPQALVDQLALGGVLVVPVGPRALDQQLLRYRKLDGGLRVEDLGPVAFVPMVPASSR